MYKFKKYDTVNINHDLENLTEEELLFLEDFDKVYGKDSKWWISDMLANDDLCRYVLILEDFATTMFKHCIVTEKFLKLAKE
jgi:hypothetical protein